MLRQGRDADDVRRKLDRAFLKLEIEHLIEPYRRDDNLSTTLREVTALGAELVEEGCHIEYMGGLPVVVDRWKSSVAMIYGPTGEGIGTGFLVAPTIVATADHVVANLGAFEVEFEGGPVVSETLFKQLAEEEKSLNEGLGFAAVVPSEWIQDILDGKIETTESAISSME